MGNIRGRFTAARGAAARPQCAGRILTSGGELPIDGARDIYYRIISSVTYPLHLCYFLVSLTHPKNNSTLMKSLSEFYVFQIILLIPQTYFVTTDNHKKQHYHKVLLVLVLRVSSGDQWAVPYRLPYISVITLTDLQGFSGICPSLRGSCPLSTATGPIIVKTRRVNTL